VCGTGPREHKVRCHALVDLNGEIGGLGIIRVRGDLDRGPDHLVVLGGSRQFDGIAGKLTIHNMDNVGIDRGHITKKRKFDRFHFDLVR
jgi:hypothetical protein